MDLYLPKAAATEIHLVRSWKKRFGFPSFPSLIILHFHVQNKYNSKIFVIKKLV